MKYLPLVWRNLLRKKVRTLFTVLSIAVAFILFSYLAAIGTAFNMGIDVSGQHRLLSIHAVSLIQPLPLSHLGRIRTTPGVVAATHATWFGGKYQDHFEGRFGIFPVVPEEYLAMYPEFLLPEEQRQAWLANRGSVIVGRKIADDFGWQVGDRIPIQGTIFHKRDGGMMWEFDLAGIYDGDQQGVDETQFLMHWEYFNEARDQLQDMVGWFMIRIDDPTNSAAIAQRIDANFANSAYETETSTEKAFMQGFANQIGNIGAILRFVLTAVFFTILLVAGNTMAQSVRERTSELAVLKTLGFSDGLVLGLVLAESFGLAALGGLGGLAVGLTLVTVLGDPTGGGLPFFYVPGHRLATGVAITLALGLVTGLLPALQAMRLRITDALRRA
jgi:putative ABC transport system permease protein